MTRARYASLRLSTLSNTTLSTPAGVRALLAAAAARPNLARVTVELSGSDTPEEALEVLGAAALLLVVAPRVLDLTMQYPWEGCDVAVPPVGCAGPAGTPPCMGTKQRCVSSAG